MNISGPLTINCPIAVNVIPLSALFYPMGIQRLFLHSCCVSLDFILLHFCLTGYPAQDHSDSHP